MKKNNFPVFICLAVCLMLSACKTASDMPAAAESAVPESKRVDTAAVASAEGKSVGEMMECQRIARKMNSAELVAAIAALNQQPAPPKSQMMKAVYYANLHGPGDLQRALNLLDQLTRSSDAEVQRYRSMAIFLSALYGDWIKIDENNDRLMQQARENQKRIDQLTEKLEAIKNIERKLQDRAGTANGIAGDGTSQSETLNR